MLYYTIDRVAYWLGWLEFVIFNLLCIFGVGSVSVLTQLLGNFVFGAFILYFNWRVYLGVGCWYMYCRERVMREYWEAFYVE